MTEALNEERRAGSIMHSANLLRLRGELLLLESDDNQPKAEACFRNAIAVAQAQAAKSWELRAAISLCRRCREGDQQKEALTSLAELYRWFTEGFDDTDLREARALLAQHAGV